MNQSADTGLEDLTQAYGKEVFARLNRTGPVLFSPAWFDDQMMAWSMADEVIKVQLFRFIDALPLLKTPESVSSHLREYLGEAGERLPVALRAGLKRLPATGAPGRLLAWLARVNAQRLARKFMGGSNLSEALNSIARLRKPHMAFTIDLLCEATISDVEAEDYARPSL